MVVDAGKRVVDIFISWIVFSFFDSGACLFGLKGSLLSVIRKFDFIMAQGPSVDVSFYWRTGLVSFLWSISSFLVVFPFPQLSKARDVQLCSAYSFWVGVRKVLGFSLLCLCMSLVWGFSPPFLSLIPLACLFGLEGFFSVIREFWLHYGPGVDVSFYWRLDIVASVFLLTEDYLL